MLPQRSTCSSGVPYPRCHYSPKQRINYRTNLKYTIICVLPGGGLHSLCSNHLHRLCLQWCSGCSHLDPGTVPTLFLGLFPLCSWDCSHLIPVVVERIAGSCRQKEAGEVGKEVRVLVVLCSHRHQHSIASVLNTAHTRMGSGLTPGAGVKIGDSDR